MISIDEFPKIWIVKKVPVSTNQITSTGPLLHQVHHQSCEGFLSPGGDGNSAGTIMFLKKGGFPMFKMFEFDFSVFKCWTIVYFR